MRRESSSPFAVDAASRAIIRGAKRATKPAIPPSFAAPALLLTACSFLLAARVAVAEVPTIVVTATRVEQPIADVPAHVTVITREQIRRSAAETVDDLLRSIPGFSLFRRSSSIVAHPTTQGVSLRGVGPSGVSRTLVLLDGVPLNDPFGGWVYWSKIPLESIERIEVVRGGGSSVWGNYAMGGVINVITTKPDAERARASVEGGNHAGVQAQALLSERGEHGGMVLDGAYFRTDGYHVLSAAQRGAIDARAGSEHGVLRGRMDFDVGPAVTASLSSYLFTEDRHNGTPLTANETQSAFFRGALAGDGGGGRTWHLDAFSQVQRFASTFSSQATDRSSETPALDQFDVPSASVGTSFLWSRTLARDHLVTVGSDAVWADGETNEDYLFVDDGAGDAGFTRRRRAGGSQLLAGAYVQDYYAPSLRWSVTAAVRLDYWLAYDGMRRERSLETGEILRDDVFADRDQIVVSPKLGALFAATDRLTLDASVYRGFRAPTINELYRPFRVRNDVTEANDALDVEQLTGADLGLTFASDASSGRDRLVTSLTGYWNRVDDAVANVTVGSGPGTVDPCGFVPDGGVCRLRRNLGRTRILGLEAEADLRLTSRLSVRASYLFSDAEITSAAEAPETEGNRVPQVPRHQGTAGLDYEGPGGFDASVEARYVGDQFEDDLNTLVLDDYFTVDAVVSKRLGSRWELFVRAENLLGARAEAGKTADGLVTVGAPTLVHAGLRYRTGP